MKMNTLLIAAPLALLTACNSQPSTPEVLDSNPDPMANQIANAAPVELPPAIRADKTFRCADGSVIGIAFFQGDTQVNVRIPATGKPTRLTAPAKGDPYTADGGWKLTGDDSAVTLTEPGKKALSCHT
ncbi:hypothetical protein ASG67_03145 [Sphingomonas sp. Leaf339]|nr:hypothetical protein ASG67_03145 [Sphingomonas sp. Leaf339]